MSAHPAHAHRIKITTWLRQRRAARENQHFGHMVDIGGPFGNLPLARASLLSLCQLIQTIENK